MSRKLATKLCLIVIVLVLAVSVRAFAFTGPSSGSGIGGGAISTDGSSNVGIGVGANSSIRLQVEGADTSGSKFGLKVLDSGSTPTFTVRNDGVVVIASTTWVAASGIKFSDNSVISSANGLGGGATTTPAALISSVGGFFGSLTGGGNYSFSAGLTADNPTFVVDSVNHRVGIGTASPGAKLEVDVGIGGNPQLRLGGGGNYWDLTTAYNYTDSDLIFSMAGTEKFRVNANGEMCLGYAGANCTGGYSLVAAGNVGIGTTNPTSQLHVSNSATAAIQQIETGVAAFSVLKLVNPTNSLWIGAERTATGGIMTGSIANAGVIVVPQNQALQFGTNDTARMTILGGGNVGIGTAAPGGTLEIESADTTVRPALRIRATAGQAYGFDFDHEQVSTGYLALYSVNNGVRTLGLVQSRATGKEGNVGIGLTGGINSKLTVAGVIESTTGGMKFPDGTTQTTAASGSGGWTRSAPYLYPTTLTDFVGIGTTAPSQRLEVGLNGGIGFSGPSLNATDKFLYSPADGALEWRTAAGAGNHAFRVSNNGTVVVNLDSNGNSYLNGGNVGIGTAAPASKLTVAGAHADTQFRLFSDLYVQGIDGANTALLSLWASEPSLSWTGTGIGNNVVNSGGITRITATRGGSYIRLLDNQINFNTVNSSGVDTGGVTISGGTLTATSFTGAGTGLTGTAASLNVGGTAGSTGVLTGSAYTNGSDGWFRSVGGTGWFNATYSVGVYATQAGRVDLYNGASLYVPGNSTVVGSETAGSFNGPGTGLTGTAASLTAGAVPWSGVTSQPAFAANANAGRVRMYEVGCGAAWGTSCDVGSSGYVDYADTAGTATNITAYTINQSVGTGNAPTFAGLTSNGNVGVTGQGSFVADGVGADNNAYGTLGVTRAASADALSYISMTRSGNVVRAMGINASNNWVFGASTGGTQIISPFMVIDGSGNTTFGSSGTAKITVGTVDPPYTIGGKQYATYLAGMTGQKEESTGIAKLTCSGNKCERTIAFGSEQEGSDLWLFAKTTDLKNHMADMTVLLSPTFDGKVWYRKDAAGSTLTILASADGLADGAEVSYRLTAPRFDSENWTNTRNEPGVEGMKIAN